MARYGHAVRNQQRGLRTTVPRARGGVRGEMACGLARRPWPMVEDGCHGRTATGGGGRRFGAHSGEQLCGGLKVGEGPHPVEPVEVALIRGPVMRRDAGSPEGPAAPSPRSRPRPGVRSQDAHRSNDSGARADGRPERGPSGSTTAPGVKLYTTGHFHRLGSTA